MPLKFMMNKNVLLHLTVFLFQGVKLSSNNSSTHCLLADLLPTMTHNVMMHAKNLRARERAWIYHHCVQCKTTLSWSRVTWYKEHSQLTHIRISYHWITNLHITETRNILFLSRYLIKYHRMSKATLKNRCFRKRLKIKRNTAKIEADSYIKATRIFFFQV